MELVLLGLHAMRCVALVLVTSGCALSSEATNSIVSDAEAIDPVLVNESSSLVSDSVGVSFLAYYPGCPELRVQADLWKLVDGQPVFQNRCVTGPDGWGLCLHREVQPIGASASAFFFNAWRATSDCGGYAGVVHHDVTGIVRPSDTYNAFTADRVVAVQKRSYEVRLDGATGAIYELYSLRFPGHRLNAIHANMGAALQLAFHDSTPIMTNACGDGSSGVNYWNPTQGGAYCLFHNGAGQHTITQPSATTIRSDAPDATTLATSEHNLMNWSYGIGYEGPWNLGDVARLRQTVTTYEDYFLVDWVFTNIGATRKGFAELPAFYFSNGFRESWIQPTETSSLVYTVLPLIPAPSLGDTQPASSLGAGPLLNGRFYGDHQAHWAMFRSVDDPTQLYTLAWFYSPELRADRTDPPSFQIGQTSFNMKFGSYYSFTAQSNVGYRIRYAVFPFAIADAIEFRGGRDTVAAAIEVLRNEIEGVPARGGRPVPTAVAPLDRVASNDALAGWGPELAVDGLSTTAYSSAYFAGAANDRGTYLAAWSSAGPQTVSQVLLRARLVDNRPAGFPTHYRVYVANAANDGWDVVADDLDWTPNAEGLVAVPFAPRQTAGVLLVPLELATDSGGNHYFQLAELSWAR